MKLKAEELAYLRRKVEQEYGKSIESAADCRLLSDKLFEKLGLRISPQTFRRIFGLISSSNGFEDATLNALARFVGSSDIATLISEQQKDFNVYIQSVVMMYENIFKVDDGRSQKYWLINDHLTEQAITNAKLMEVLVPTIMKYPAGRVHFLEYHPLRDFICTDYKKFFIEYQKYKSNNEALLFTHGFLGIGDYLSENFEEFEKRYQLISRITLNSDIHHVPAARKFGLPILYAFYTKDEVLYHSIVEKMLAVRPNYFESAKWAICSFDYIILDHLMLTDKYELFGNILQTRVQQEKDDVTPEVRQNYHREVWKLFKAFSEHHTGNRARAEELLESFDIEKINFGWKMYYELQYLSLYQNYITNHTQLKEIKNRIKMLISKTKFSYFNRFI